MITALLLLFPIQSFVITNIIKGMTLFNTISIVLLIKNFIFFKRKFLTYFILFLFLYIVYFFIGQFGIVLFNDKISKDIILISSESLNDFNFRKSFFTQSLYLIIVVVFYLKLLEFLKKHGKDTVIKISFLSIWIFIFYGYLEFFMYLITGINFDSISNRIAAEDTKIGMFQTITILGHSIQRMKSLTGEPSMFAYTLLPFFILSIYLKKRIFMLFSLFTLILTTSTTAILGLVIYFLFDLIYRKNKILKIFIFSIFFSICFIVFYDLIISLYTIVEVKLNLENESGIVRYSNIINHFNGWYDSNIINKFFGYGFGYARSTDGFTTLLFNTGIIGVAIYTLFFILPYFLIKKKTDYIKGLYISNFVLLIVIFASVSEFYYPHIWIFNALLWHEYLNEKYKRRKRYVNN